MGALTRSFRSKLTTIDGATVVTHDGHFLCTGTILKTKGSHKGGGGRTVAAYTLGLIGLGIKVSNDGKITLYSIDENQKEIEFEWG